MNTTALPDVENIANDEDVLYQKDAVFDAEISISNYTYDDNVTESTTQGPRLEQKVTETSGAYRTTQPLATERPCPLDCGPGGGCIIKDNTNPPFCLCPLGRGGDRCEKGKSI